MNVTSAKLAHCPPAGHNWDERRGEYVADEAELEDLEAGADPNLQDVFGITPLIHAAARGR